MDIYRTDKFFHAEEQYRLDAGNVTILRLTLGRTGGKVKTATVGDSRARPAYHDYPKVIQAFDNAVRNVCGRDIPVYVMHDRGGRLFGEVGGSGDRQDFLEFLEKVGLYMADELGLEKVH